MSPYDDRNTDNQPEPARPTGVLDIGVSTDATAAAPLSGPITIWRLDDDRGEPTRTQRDASFASRLAQRLVEVYTDPHDTIADLDSDPHLHDAAEAAGRYYRAISSPAYLNSSDTTRAGNTLAVWRWPRHTWPTKATSLFAACRLLTAPDGCVITAIRSADPGEQAASHADNLTRLMPAAATAGFRHVLQIVAVGGCTTGDQFLYHATTQEAQAAVDPLSDQRVCRIDLLEFASAGHHDQP